MIRDPRKSAWRRVVISLMLIVISPLIVLILVLYGLYALLIHILLWLGWGTRVLFVYSNSPVWQSYIEQNILPKLPARSVVLNWSERRNWRQWWLAYLAFSLFGGSRQFNPIAVVVRPLHWTKTFRFWQAFRDFKHGKRQTLDEVEAKFFDHLDQAGLKSV